MVYPLLSKEKGQNTKQGTTDSFFVAISRHIITAALFPKKSQLIPGVLSRLIVVIFPDDVHSHPSTETETSLGFEITKFETTRISKK